MSIKLKIPSNARFYWDKKCVHCGCDSDKRDIITRARYKGKGYYVFFFTYTQQLLEISYPVCLKHKIFAKSCRFTYWLLLIPVIVLGLTALLGPLAGDKFEIKFVIAFLVLLIIFVLSITLQPLLIVEANDYEIVLKFRNEKIANEFIINNRLQRQVNAKRAEAGALDRQISEEQETRKANTLIDDIKRRWGDSSNITKVMIILSLFLLFYGLMIIIIE